MHLSNYFKVIHELKNYFINRGWNTYDVNDIYPTKRFVLIILNSSFC
jgi:hypothetical protein